MAPAMKPLDAYSWPDPLCFCSKDLFSARHFSLPVFPARPLPAFCSSGVAAQCGGEPTSTTQVFMVCSRASWLERRAVRRRPGQGEAHPMVVTDVVYGTLALRV